MKKNICRIFIVIIFIILFCSGYTYGAVYTVPDDTRTGLIGLTDIRTTGGLGYWQDFEAFKNETILQQLKDYYGYEEELKTEIRIDTTINIESKNMWGNYQIIIGNADWETVQQNNTNVETFNDLSPTTYHRDAYSREELIEKFGVSDEWIDNEEREPWKVVFKAIVPEVPETYSEPNSGYSTAVHHIYVKKIWSERDIDELDNSEFESGEDVELDLPDNSELVNTDIVGGILDELLAKIADVIISLIRGLGDIFQILTNLMQRGVDGTASNLWVTYSYEDLTSDTATAKIVNQYTKVDVDSNCEIQKQISKKYNNTSEEYGFTKETRIPVIEVDLYTMAANKVSLLDANFLDTSTHSSDSIGDLIWMKFRNFITSLIYVVMYITAACLLVTLIWHGIKLVRKSFTSPKERKEHVEGLQKFAVSVVLLVGVIVIEALCIYASDMFLEDITTGERTDKELPIRVTVEGVYSFSTTPTGYCRYMSEIENLNLIGPKAAYAGGYLVLALLNLICMIGMFVRMLAMMLLSILGFVIILINLFSKENSSKWKFSTWVAIYAGFAAAQILLALICRLILTTGFIT